jgi:phage baseplate assembly protein W
MNEHFAKAFLGRGWAFPVALDATRVALAEYDEDVRQAVLIIVQTNHHERVMRPDFGANLRTLSLARHQVERALVLWEPRIDTVSVQVRTVRPEPRMDIEITYRVRRTNAFYNLVYPFYVSEARTEALR